MNDLVKKYLGEFKKFKGFKHGGEGSTNTSWELCDPKSKDDCVEVEVNIPWVWEPEEKDVGFSAQLTIDGEVTFTAPATFMGKNYRVGQDFPRALQKYVYDHSKTLKRKGWDYFLGYEVERSDRRW